MLLEIQQLSRQWCAFWNKVRIATGFLQIIVSEFVECQQARDLTHVNHANDLVNVLTVQWQARVRGSAQLPNDLIKIAIEVDTKYLVAWNHNVIDGDVFQIKDA